MNNIPKIFFSYWDGNIMSYLQYLTVKSFQDLNPDWKIIIYMPEKKYDHITWNGNEQKLPYQGDDYLDKLYQLDIEIIKIDFEDISFFNDVSEVHKSDYLRYYMLDKHGGMWSDMDIIFTQPIEKIMNPNLQCFGDRNKVDTIIAYINSSGFLHYPIGILISCKNNSFYKNLAQQSKNFFNKNYYQCIGVAMINYLYSSPSTIKKKHPELNILILDNKSYLPYNWNQINDIFIVNKPQNMRPYTVGIHWFNGSNESKKYQMLINNNQLPKTGSIYPYLEKYLNE